MRIIYWNTLDLEIEQGGELVELLAAREVKEFD
jgi:hypothetical protein